MKCDDYSVNLYPHPHALGQVCQIPHIKVVENKYVIYYMLLNALKYTTLLLFNHYQPSKMESVSKIIILHGMSIPHYSNYDFFPLGKQSLPVNKTPLQNRN